MAKAPVTRCDRGFQVLVGREALQNAHVRGLRTLLALLDVEFDSLRFFEVTVTRTCDRAEVDEDVFATTVGSDKAEALLAVEPLHSSLCHTSSTSFI